MAASPVFSVPEGSISSRVASSVPTGWCSAANRHHEQLAAPDFHIAVAHANSDPTRQHREEIVSVIVMMSVEFALDLHHHDVVSVERGNGPRQPMLVELRKLFRQIG